MKKSGQEQAAQAQLTYSILNAFTSLFWEPPHPCPKKKKKFPKNPTSSCIMCVFILFHSLVFSCCVGQRRWGWVRAVDTDTVWCYPAVWIGAFLRNVCGCDLQTYPLTKRQYGSNARTKKHTPTLPQLHTQADRLMHSIWFDIKSSLHLQNRMHDGKKRYFYLTSLHTCHLSPPSLCFILIHCCPNLSFHLPLCLSLSTPPLLVPVAACHTVLWILGGTSGYALSLATTLSMLFQ